MSATTQPTSCEDCPHPDEEGPTVRVAGKQICIRVDRAKVCADCPHKWMQDQARAA